MRVVMLADGLGLGGSERTASILATFLAKRGHEVTYVCVNHNRIDYSLGDDAEIVMLDVRNESSMMRLVRRSHMVDEVLSSRPYDTALSFVPRESAYAALRGHRIVQSVRNDPGHIRLVNRLPYSISLLLAPVVVFQTTGARDCYVDAIRRKGIVLPNPFDADALPLWDADRRDNRFVAVGRLSPQKNFGMLIRAFVAFHRSRPGFELDIYGEETSGAVRGATGERDVLEHLISDLHAGSYIHLKGFSRNVHDMLAHAYAFVMSSDYEGVSNSMLEALCMGVPSIVTDHSPGGAREYVRHMENGWLVPVGDEPKMAEALTWFVDNPDASRTLGEHALDLRHSMGIDSVCSQWEHVLAGTC